MDGPLVDSEQADSEPQRRGGPWKLILLVIIVTLVGLWLVPSDTPEPVTDRTISPPPQLLPPAEREPSLLGTEQAAPTLVEPATETTAAAEAAIDETPGARARELIGDMRARGDVDLDKIYMAAGQAQAEGELSDAYLLYFFAAREGHAEAAMVLGEQADPASFKPGNGLFDAPDAVQAHKWYRMAVDNGNPEAQGKLQALRTRIEKLAASGDPQAQRTALLWQ